jgi:hypothetical protein
LNFSRIKIINKCQLFSDDHSYSTFVLGNAEIIIRPVPKHVNSLPLNLCQSDLLKGPQPFVAEVKNAKLISSQAVAFDQNDNIVEEAILPPNPHSGFKFESLPLRTFILPRFPIPKMSAKFDLACSLVNIWSKNYYHWIIEDLPRLEGLEHYQIQQNQKPVLILNSNPKAWQIESLKLLGYDQTTWTEWQYPSAFVKKLVVPSYRRIAGFVSPTGCQWLRQRIFANLNLSVSHPQSRRIYISRSQAACRRVVNELDVLAMLMKYGFEPYILENLSFSEQVSLFSQAEAIISPHGAGLTNMIFGKSKTIIIELFNPDPSSSQVNACYANLASALNFPYGCMICNPSRKSFSFSRTEADMVVEVEKLERLVKEML